MPVTNYIYDPVTEAYLMETDGDGKMTAWYTQEPVKYGDVLAQHRIDPTTGVGESFYYHTDALGSTRELTDSSGTVVNTYTYDAFGNTISSTGTVKNPFRFTGNVGYYFDEELDTYHIRARNYEPTTGRWMSQDPLLFVDGANLYEAYFIPFGIDPSGLWGPRPGVGPNTPPEKVYPPKGFKKGNVCVKLYVEQPAPGNRNCIREGLFNYGHAFVTIIGHDKNGTLIYKTQGFYPTAPMASQDRMPQRGALGCDDTHKYHVEYTWVNTSNNAPAIESLL